MKNKKHIKTALSLAMTVLMIMAAGCSSSDPPEPLEQEIMDFSDDGQLAINSFKGDLQGATFKSSSDFSEDRAWVEYLAWLDTGEKKAYALIDTQGQILWESAPITMNATLDFFTDFQDGLACFGKSDTDFSIIDSEGTVTFTQKGGELHLLEYGGGKFLVAQHVSNFDTNEWQIGAIDKAGNLAVPLKAYVSESGGNLSLERLLDCDYMGDGLFYLRFLDPLSGYVSIAQLDIESQSIASYDYPEEYFQRLENGGDLRFYDGAYYNLSDEMVIDFPEYRGSRSYQGSPFSGSYAVLTVKGADEFWYCTVIDKQGNKMFEPRTGFDILSITDDTYMVAEWTLDTRNSKTVTDFGEFAGKRCMSVMDVNGKLLLSVVGPVGQDMIVNPVSCGLLRVQNKYYGDVYIDVSDGSLIASTSHVDPEYLQVILH